MASLVRIGFARLTNTVKPNAAQIRNISGKTMRAQARPVKPAPWDFKNKRYTILHQFMDKTTKRFDENSKVIVVEGPIAAGKSKFAKELAAELEMQYFPEANLDMFYINDYGFDLRKLDEQLPDTCKSFDVYDFLINPKHRLVARFQIEQYIVKFSQYIDALAHLLSSGQGVVLDRCVYSDFVFVEAMYRQGYLSKGAYSTYYEIRDNSLQELMRPHLIIYLDIPVNKIMENIKKRNIACEVNSSAITPQYLATMEKMYKQNYLKDISKYSELLVYDWSNEGDVEVVVEDVERISFENLDMQNPKFTDWMINKEALWAEKRRYYADKKEHIMTYMNVPRFDVDELVTPAPDCKQYYDVIDNAPGEFYQKGYNRELGDGSTLFKMTSQHRETLELRERRKF